MTITRRFYLVIGLVALIALAFSAVTLSSRLTSAGAPDPTPVTQTCDQQDKADGNAETDAAEADTDNIQEQCGDQNGAEDASAGTDTAVSCSDPSNADDATEARGGPDTDNIHEQCGDQNQTDWGR